MWICDLVLERLKKIYGWKIWFEYDYLQSHLVIITFKQRLFFTASLNYEQRKVKENYGLMVWMCDINMVISCLSCFVVIYFQTEA